MSSHSFSVTQPQVNCFASLCPSSPVWKKILHSYGPLQIWWGGRTWTSKGFSLWELGLRPSKVCSEPGLIYRGHTGHGLLCSLLIPEEERYIFAQTALRSMFSCQLCQYAWLKCTRTGRRAMSCCLSMHVSLVTPCGRLAVWKSS